MPILISISCVLAWIGRQRVRAVAAIVLIGIAVPSAGAVLRPYTSASVFVLLMLSFMRADFGALRRTMARPGLALAAAAWTMLLLPSLAIAAMWALGVATTAPDLATALTLHAIASPLMSSPALAALMGLDATLALTTLILGSLLVSVTAPAFVALYSVGVHLSPVALGLKLSALLSASAALAVLVRRVAGTEAIARRRDELDGINVLLLYVFIASLTSDFAAQLMASPLTVIGLIAFAFALNLGLVIVTTLIFLPAGRERAFAIAVVTSQRNMGIMLAAVGSTLPAFVWLYVAIANFPIYLAPLMLTPVARRITARTVSARSA